MNCSLSVRPTLGGLLTHYGLERDLEKKVIVSNVTFEYIVYVTIKPKIPP